jgi:hypothetical protein
MYKSSHSYGLRYITGYINDTLHVSFQLNVCSVQCWWCCIMNMDQRNKLKKSVEDSYLKFK